MDADSLANILTVFPLTDLYSMWIATLVQLINYECIHANIKTEICRFYEIKVAFEEHFRDVIIVTIYLQL